jgi:predicted transcriptional regulator
MSDTAVDQKVVRLSVNLSKDVADALRWIAKKRQISATEAIRRAISTQAYVEEAHDRGAKILVKEPNEDTLRELVFIR